ncbi:hypothetical protein PhCBS80983_g03330 [Powellomyces hirtus]|uniref:Extracellular metalloproteinase n=1 Tax=Powellomyces hirtus TaxID=109895 RepID=A0A507E2W7_9FUNG|nr:hypothetical protein PhCBS80983_g03330 [Powellomyces hirtus]
MVKFLRVILAASLLTAVAAAPVAKQELTFPQPFHRTPVFESFGSSGTPAPANFARTSGDADKDAALAYIAGQSGFNTGDFEISNDYIGSNGLRHIYVRRAISGIAVANQVANVAINDGKIFSFGSNLPAKTSFRGSVEEPANGSSAADAIQIAERASGLKANPDALAVPFQRYIETAENELKYVWTVQVKSAPADTKLQWYEVDVAVATGEIVRATNWVREVKYTAIPLASQTSKENYRIVTEPQDKNASPKGWTTPVQGVTGTIGNNAAARTSAGKLLAALNNDHFNSIYNFAADPVDPRYASTGNAFYVVNAMHDVFYRYGFNEKAGNFQTDNFGKGGAGNDAIKITLGSDQTDNAFFATPPDGYAGEMSLYTFTRTTPKRDAAMENAVIIHEYTHGLSTRLTGGPANVNCLDAPEAGGMGEGWGDVLAMLIARKGTDTRQTDYGVGAWIMGTPRGIRSEPYSTDMTRNTKKYSTIGANMEPHAVGEVWASMLNEVYWNLVDTQGFSGRIVNPPAPSEHKGDVMLMFIILDAMALQPCNPTFITARNAMFQADQVRYGGKNRCAMWRAFAKRGLGANAAAPVGTAYKDDFGVPVGCGKKA